MLNRIYTLSLIILIGNCIVKILLMSNAKRVLSLNIKLNKLN